MRRWSGACSVAVKTLPKRCDRTHGRRHREIEHYVESDYLIVNETFDVALDELRSIVRSNRVRPTAQSERHAELIAALAGGR